MYLKMYGFDEKPFHITPNPRFIFLSKIHKEAFAHLLYGIQQRVGFMSLSGEIGTGKTTVLRTLLGQLEDAEYCVALIFNPCLTALELLQTVHREFAIDFDRECSNLVELHESLNRFLLQQRKAGRTVVLVVDEAQNLDPKVLEELRLLSNLETETEKLIQMVLVGQPELDELLQRQDLRQLRQRLAVSYQLQPLDREDTEHYVQHRIRIAGSSNRALFDPQALELVYKYTQGTPRLINLLCDRSLLVAYGRDAHTVSKDDVKSAHKELRQQKELPKRSLQPVLIVFSVILLLAVIIKLFTLPSQTPVEALQAATVAEQKPLEAVSTALTTLDGKPVSQEQIQRLVQKIAAIGTADSGEMALQDIVQSWGKELPAFSSIRGRGGMTRALELSGFDVVELQASIDDLLRLDVPVVIEVSLPNVAGKRFMAISGYANGQVRTVPSLSTNGWLDVAELKEIWFGKLLLPFLNFQSIALLDLPGEVGEDVAAVQTLLSTLAEVDLPLSGRYDQETITAVAQFQRRMDLAPDGRVGGHTLFWLYRQAGYQMPRLLVED